MSYDTLKLTLLSPWYGFDGCEPFKKKTKIIIHAFSLLTLEPLQMYVWWFGTCYKITGTNIQITQDLYTFYGLLDS